MIPVFKPSYGQEEVDAVARVLASGWTGLGPEAAKFEEEFADYIGVEYAVATNSGTAALYMAMECLPDDRRKYIITTPYTFVSTNHAIMHSRWIPYFCDVEYDTMNIDLDKIPEEVLEDACAIMCVHFGGHACNMDRILDLASEYDLKVIEDAAHGCGGKHYWNRLGSIGDMGCFSFHAVKNLSCGSGGMLITDDKAVYEKARSLRWFGVDRSTWDRAKNMYTWEYDVTELGHNYYMNDTSAAIGRIQLEKLEDANLLREGLADRYTRFLCADDAIGVPIQERYAHSVWHNYVIKVPERDILHETLQEIGVGSSVHYKPNTLYSMYAGYDGPCPVAMDVYTKAITLPLYPDLLHEDQDRIINAVLDHAENCRT